MVAQALRKCECWKRMASRSLPIWGLVLSPSSGRGPQRDRPAATTNQRNGHSLKKVQSAESRGWLAHSLVCWFSTPGINRRTQMAQFRRTKWQSTWRTLSWYHFWVSNPTCLFRLWTGLELVWSEGAPVILPPHCPSSRRCVNAVVQLCHCFRRFVQAEPRTSRVQYHVSHKKPIAGAHSPGSQQSRPWGPTTP